MMHQPPSLPRAPVRRTRLATRRGGLLLLWLLSLSTLVLAMTLAYFPVLRATTYMSSHMFRLEQALLLADAGLERGVWELRTRGGQDLNTAGGWNNAAACDDLDGSTDTPAAVYGMPITSCAQTTQVQTLQAGDNFGGVIGEYDVSIVNYGGAGPARIIARSYLPSRADPSATRQTAVLDMTAADTSLSGLYGAMGVQLVGAAPVYVDSYNSTTGPYDANNPGTNGNIGTNGNTPNLWPADLYIENAGTIVKGTATYKTDESVINNGTVTGGVIAGPARPALPHVTIPSSLTSLPITTTLGSPAGVTVTETGDGHFRISAGTYTCTQPMHIRSLYLLGGTFELADGCKLFIDSTGSNPYWKRAGTWGSNGIGLDTDTNAQLLKTGTGTTQIFVRDTSVDLDGNGIHYADAVPAADRKPIHLQLYVTCADTSNCNRDSWGTNLRQQPDFYGAIYMEGSGGVSRGATMNLDRSSINSASHQSNYYGMFATSGGLSSWAEAGTDTSGGHWEGVGHYESVYNEEYDEWYDVWVGPVWVADPPINGFSPHIHVDETLQLNSSGTFVTTPPGQSSSGQWQIKPGSWAVYTVHQ